MIYRKPVAQWIANAPRRLPRVVYENLTSSERVVTVVREHPVAIIRPVLLIVGGACLAGLVTGVGDVTGGLVLVIWLLWGVLFAWQGWKVATWWRTYFVVTANRLMLVTSLLHNHVAMMPLAQVTNMRTHESTFGRMLGYGEFIAESAGQEQRLRPIRFMPFPSRMSQEIASLTHPGSLRLPDRKGLRGLQGRQGRRGVPGEAQAGPRPRLRGLATLSPKLL